MVDVDHFKLVNNHFGHASRDAVATHDFAHGRPMTASFGVAAWREGQPLQELIENADANL